MLTYNAQRLVHTNQTPAYDIQYSKTLYRPADRQGGDERMPLTFAKEGEVSSIKKIGGREDVRQFLENLGFVVGAAVTVISATGGNLIVNIKDSRVAIGKDMASRIMV